MRTSKLIQLWQMAAKDLGLNIIAPFTLELSSAVKIEAELLLKNFGASKGMIVFNKYDQVAPYVDEIVNAGYGFSVLEEPDKNRKYIKNGFIEMLGEWGWSGCRDKKPSWL